MKWSQLWKAFIVTLVIIFAMVAISYSLMRPRDPRFEYRFLSGHKPIQIGLRQDEGGSVTGSEFAVYSWQEPFDGVAARAKAEITGTMPIGPDTNFVLVDNSRSVAMAVMSTRLTTGRLTYKAEYDVYDPNWVTVVIERDLPEGLWSKLRLILFKTRS